VRCGADGVGGDVAARPAGPFDTGRPKGSAGAACTAAALGATLSGGLWEVAVSAVAWTADRPTADAVSTARRVPGAGPTADVHVQDFARRHDDGGRSLTAGAAVCTVLARTTLGAERVDRDRRDPVRDSELLVQAGARLRKVNVALPCGCSGGGGLVGAGSFTGSLVGAHWAPMTPRLAPTTTNASA
jgi:hypothetical protein